MSVEPELVWTIGKVLAAAKDFLERHGSGSPRLEAERLMAFILKLDRVDLYMQIDRPLTEAERHAYKQVIKDRAEGNPVQYITGEQGFRRLVLKVTPDVLIPRPETELLVDVAVNNLQFKPGTEITEPKPEILEIGTGSGAIAISLAFEHPVVLVWALDISSRALEVARDNASKYNVDESIIFFESDLFEQLEDHHRKPFDAIVANPPYITSDEMASLPAEVLREPHLALDGGQGGLDYIKRISAGARQYIKTGGFLALEIGAEQADGVSDILLRDSYSDIRVFKDYAKRDRVVVGWRKH